MKEILSVRVEREKREKFHMHTMKDICMSPGETIADFFERDAVK